MFNIFVVSCFLVNFLILLLYFVKFNVESMSVGMWNVIFIILLMISV